MSCLSSLLFLLSPTLRLTVRTFLYRSYLVYH